MAKRAPGGAYKTSFLNRDISHDKMMCPETGRFVCFTSDVIGGGFGPEKLDFRREGPFCAFNKRQRAFNKI